ncbi:transporter substrate-binding domain-containing protein [Pseudomonas sp. 1928-m]|uniref:substrate-binding periplasmic protein n=1 Tax=Pseudomonas sp. 1928-m TaxID=3033804 RepID=UPI0023E00AB7|nr:transporter substrate-binding domain-containing protein [Pseudomonas sp. 1928-m]MDF3195300.1 transporter substrate-binding domain-containing protein [Pseudomonas sp. 1928-m]
MGRCCRWLLWLVISVASGLVCAAEPAQIRIASETWEGHTHADGSGMAWEIFRTVFEPAGVQLDIQSVPYTRSIGLVQRGAADAWAGSYLNEVTQGVFYPHWNYDADQIAALGLRDKPIPTQDSLGEYRLAWMRGYEYQRYLPNLRQYREVLRRSGILGMLDMGHVDFYLDALTEVEDVLSTASQPERYRVTQLTKLPIYLGFADTPRGRTLAELFDKRMDGLVADGSLRPIFQRWQQPYPFD